MEEKIKIEDTQGLENLNSNNTDLTPSEYFDIVKGRKQKITDKDLQAIYDNCLELLNKYKITLSGGKRNGMFCKGF